MRPGSGLFARAPSSSISSHACLTQITNCSALTPPWCASAAAPATALRTSSRAPPSLEQCARRAARNRFAMSSLSTRRIYYVCLRDDTGSELILANSRSGPADVIVGMPSAAVQAATRGTSSVMSATEVLNAARASSTVGSNAVPRPSSRMRDVSIHGKLARYGRLAVSAS